MIYIAWAGFYEGASDRTYYNVLLPRVVDEITRTEGLQLTTTAPTPVADLGRDGRTASRVAAEACALKHSIHILFIHADQGGRGQAETLAARSCAYCKAASEKCQWHRDRCVILTPRHETEAWLLADPSAVTGALGYTGAAESLGLPANGAMAEALLDPKAVLSAATVKVVRRRGADGTSLFTSIAQRQTLSALRQCESFRAFEARLRRALVSLGCLAPARTH